MLSFARRQQCSGLADSQWNALHACSAAARPWIIGSYWLQLQQLLLVARALHPPFVCFWMATFCINVTKATRVLMLPNFGSKLLMACYLSTFPLHQCQEGGHRENLFRTGWVKGIFQLRMTTRNTNPTAKSAAIEARVVTSATPIVSSANCRCMLLDVSNNIIRWETFANSLGRSGPTLRLDSSRPVLVLFRYILSNFITLLLL